ncbi:Conserved_hypothetical protein [Hexamita inflata]|uniref:Transmembrane protein n=1 Tax=Hexamita inflata TaxID=28002 RepID=A0ABP1I0G5_9EUKA
MTRRNELCKKIFMIVSSPIWVPLAAIFLGIFVPIQFLLNGCRIKQFQRQRRKQLLQVKNVQISNEPQVNDQLQDQVIFKFKPVHYIGIEMQITQTKIQLASNDIILYSQPVPYNFQSKYFSTFCNNIDDSRFMQAKVVEKELKIPRAQFNQPVVCYGKIFLNIFDYIFTIEDFQLKYFAQMPKYAYYIKQGVTYDGCGQMFTMNSKLYCHNQSSKLFEVQKNGKLKCVNRKHFNIQYYQYGDKVYATDERKIYLVKSNLQLQSLFELGFGRVQFIQPGALIFYSSQHKNSDVVLNMVNEEVTITANLNDQTPSTNIVHANIKYINQFNNHFQFKFKLNACQLVNKHKIKQTTTSLTQIQNQFSIQFDSVNKIIQPIINLNQKIASSYKNAFADSDQ